MVAGLVSVALVATAPIGPLVGGVPADAATPVCDVQAQSPAFQAFVAANPDIQEDNLEDQRLHFERRGALEWMRIASASAAGIGGAGMGGMPSVNDYDVETDYADVADLNLGADNPLRYMAQLAEAEALIRVNRHGEAQGVINAQIEWATRIYGADNAMLVQAFALRARSHSAEGDDALALRDAERAAALIARYPERGQVLAVTKVDMLQIQAQSRLSMAAVVGDVERELPQARALLAEAEAIRVHYSAAPMSGLMDVFSLVPGAQSLAEHRSDMRLRFADAEGHSPWDIMYYLSGVLASQPSVDVRPVRAQRFANGVAVSAVGLDCLEAAGSALQAGDFAAGDQSLAVLESMVSEDNMLKILAMAHNEEATRDLEAVLRAEPYEASQRRDWGLGLGVGRLHAVGRLEPVMRDLDRAITQRVGGAFLRAMTREADLTDGQQRALSRNTGKMWAGVQAVKTIALMAVSPIRREDLPRIRAAQSFFKNDAEPLAEAVAQMLDDPDGYGSGYEIREMMDGGGRLAIKTIVPLVLEAVQWTHHRSRGDARAKTRSEAEIYSGLEAAVAELRPNLMGQARPHLRALASGQGSPGRRALDHLRPFARLAIREVVSELGVLGEGGDMFPAVDSADAALFSGVAADLEQWTLVADIWTPTARWFIANGSAAELFVPESAGFDSNSEQGSYVAQAANIFGQMLRKPMGDYFQALQRQRRLDDAQALIDLVLPTIRAVEELPESNADAALQRILISYGIPDRVFAIAAEMLLEVGRDEDAVLLAKVRTRRRSDDNLARRLQFTPSLSAQFSRRAIEPQGQLVRAANSAFNSTAHASYMDDMVGAFDHARGASIDDASLIMAALGGPSSPGGQAFAKFLAAEADLIRLRRGQAIVMNDPAAGGAGLDATQRAGQRLNQARRDLVEEVGEDVASIASRQVTAESLQNALGADEVMIVSMPVSDEAIGLLAVTRERATVSFPNNRPALRDAARQAQRGLEISRSGMPRPTDALRLLYAGVPGRFPEAVRDKRHILVSLHDELSVAPIAAFIAPTPLAVDGGPPQEMLGLARSLQIVLRPMALVLERERNGDTPTAGGAAASLAIGDIGFRGAPGASLSTAFEGGGLGLPATPGARVNIRNFVEFSRAQSFLGTNASVAVLKRLPAHDLEYLMFHTHGLSAEAGGPGLVLYPTTGQTSLLTAADVLNLRVRPRYVLLAACHTGDAEMMGLEPYSGLVRAFLALGADGVLTAQSVVDEDSTTRLFGRFYVHLGQAHRPAEALRLAQLDLASNPITADPRLWGQFAWVGNA
ncbi:MAG: CHAT domain-containing protein [Brevundimonas sp.]|nr:CHAT domain-containing protein [Brevundimonas sp.]